MLSVAVAAEDATCDAFEPVRCDTFITESTFGLPIYRWLPESEVFSQINAWWRDNAAAGKILATVGAEVRIARPVVEVRRVEHEEVERGLREGERLLRFSRRLLVEMVDSQAKGIVHNAQSRKFVAPLALTVFVWIFLMNSMDFLPVDLLPKAGEAMGLHYMRVVPTADLSVTMGLSVAVLLICLYYNVKIKGFGGWVHELFAAPFGDKVFLYPINFLMQMIEFVAKTVSHGMRLFGNMYAGELIFMLIALMGAAWAGTAGSGAVAAGGLTGPLLFLGHIVAGTVWAIFHILIVALQAFVFMMLTLVYLGQAHDAH